VIFWSDTVGLRFWLREKLNFIGFSNNKWLKTISCLGFLLLNFCANAQQTDRVKNTDTLKPAIDTIRKMQLEAGVVTRVSGKVTDAITGKALAFTGVSFIGSTATTHADDQGNFTLSVPGRFIHVVFSNIGYQPVTRVVKPGEANQMQVRMKGSQTQLKGVTVTSGKKNTLP